MHFFFFSLALLKDYLSLSETLCSILKVMDRVILYIPSICLMHIYSDLKVDMVEDATTGTIMTMVS